MLTPESGSFRHLITYSAISTARDALGQIVQTYTPYAANIRAAIEVTESKEVINGKKPEGQVTTKFTHRYLSGIKFTDQITYDARTFQVIGINDLSELHMWHEITAVELKK